MNIENIKILTLDDQPSYLQLLSLVLKDIGLKHIRIAESYNQALSVFADFKPDICLLDIELARGQKNGIEVALAIREKDAAIPIIFLTSHFQDDFYEQVKEIRPSSFMNKELSRLKLLQAIELPLLQLENQHLQKSLQQQAQPIKHENIPYFNASSVFFKIGDTYKSIDVKTIDYFYAENKLTFARVNNRNYPTNVQLKVLEEELRPLFQRCHKKYLINVNAIDSILLKDDRIKIDTELIPIGYAYRKVFFENIKLLK